MSIFSRPHFPSSLTFMNFRCLSLRAPEGHRGETHGGPCAARRPPVEPREGHPIPQIPQGPAAAHLLDPAARPAVGRPGTVGAAVMLSSLQQACGAAAGSAAAGGREGGR